MSKDERLWLRQEEFLKAGYICTRCVEQHDNRHGDGGESDAHPPQGENGRTQWFFRDMQKMLCENHSMEEDGGAVPRAIPLMFPMQEHPAVSKLLPSRLGAQAKSLSHTTCATTNSTTETVARKISPRREHPRNQPPFPRPATVKPARTARLKHRPSCQYTTTASARQRARARCKN